MYGLAGTSRHVIQRISNPRFQSKMASYDVASIVCQGRPTPMSPVKNMALAVAGVAVARVRPRAVLRSCQCALPRTELRANEEDALRRWTEDGGGWRKMEKK